MRVVGDVRAEQLARHVRAAIVEASPDACLDELGEWLRERVERAHRGPSGDRGTVLVIWKLPGASPKNSRSTVTCAPSRQLCPETHSGYGAVMSAVHVESVVVPAFPSSSVVVIAFHGRQKSKWYLSFQQLIAASAATQVLQREESRGVGGVEVVPGDELPGDFVPTQTGCALPPLGDVRLVAVRVSFRVEPVSAEVLDLVELSRPLRAVERGRWHAAELRRALDEERLHAAHPWGRIEDRLPGRRIDERLPLSDAGVLAPTETARTVRRPPSRRAWPWPPRARPRCPAS